MYRDQNCDDFDEIFFNVWKKHHRPTIVPSEFVHHMIQPYFLHILDWLDTPRLSSYREIPQFITPSQV